MQNKEMFRVIIARHYTYYLKLEKQLKENGFQFFGETENHVFFFRTKDGITVVIDIYCLWHFEEEDF